VDKMSTNNSLSMYGCMHREVKKFRLGGRQFYFKIFPDLCMFLDEILV
jgi:hypothetical protein